MKVFYNHRIYDASINSDGVYEIADLKLKVPAFKVIKINDTAVDWNDGFITGRASTDKPEVLAAICRGKSKNFKAGVKAAVQEYEKYKETEEDNEALLESDSNGEESNVSKAEDSVNENKVDDNMDPEFITTQKGAFKVVQKTKEGYQVENEDGTFDFVPKDEVVKEKTVNGKDAYYYDGELFGEGDYAIHDSKVVVVADGLYFEPIYPMSNKGRYITRKIQRRIQDSVNYEKIKSVDDVKKLIDGLYAFKYHQGQLELKGKVSVKRSSETKALILIDDKPALILNREGNEIKNPYQKSKLKQIVEDKTIKWSTYQIDFTDEKGFKEKDKEEKKKEPNKEISSELSDSAIRFTPYYKSLCRQYGRVSDATKQMLIHKANLNYGQSDLFKVKDEEHLTYNDESTNGQRPVRYDEALAGLHVWVDDPRTVMKPFEGFIDSVNVRVAPDGSQRKEIVIKGNNGQIYSDVIKGYIPSERTFFYKSEPIEDSRMDDYREVAKNHPNNVYAQILYRLQTFLRKDKAPKGQKLEVQFKVGENNVVVKSDNDFTKVWVTVNGQRTTKPVSLSSKTAVNLCQQIATDEAHGNISLIRKKGSLQSDKLEFTKSDDLPSVVGKAMGYDSKTGGKNVVARGKGAAKRNDYIYADQYGTLIDKGFINKSDYKPVTYKFYVKKNIKVYDLPDEENPWNYLEIGARSKNKELAKAFEKDNKVVWYKHGDDLFKYDPFASQIEKVK